MASGWKSKYKEIWWHIGSLYFEGVSGIWGYVGKRNPYAYMYGYICICIGCTALDGLTSVYMYIYVYTEIYSETEINLRIHIYIYIRIHTYIYVRI